MTRRLQLAACGVAALVGFTHAALTVDVPVERPAPPAYFVEVYEDGSGVQYIRNREVATFPADTFVWDCRAMGNGVCGT